MPTYSVTFPRISKEHQQRTVTCLLGVSLLQTYSYGPRFSDMIQKLTETFDSPKIVVGDGLLIHTYMALGYDRTVATEMAAKEKAKWLDDEGVKEALALLDKDNIFYWDEWTSSPEFQQKKALVEQYYDDNQNEFRHAVEMAAFGASSSYYTNFKNKLAEGFDADKMLTECREYIKEECAVFLLWLEQSFAKDNSCYALYPKASKNHSNADNMNRCFNILKDIAPASKLTLADVELTPEKKSSKKQGKASTSNISKPSLPEEAKPDATGCSSFHEISLNSWFFSAQPQPLSHQADGELESEAAIDRRIHAEVFKYLMILSNSRHQCSLQAGQGEHHKSGTLGMNAGDMQQLAASILFGANEQPPASTSALSSVAPQIPRSTT
jgi:tRNA-dependent cyclodipeptide synthase